MRWRPRSARGSAAVETAILMIVLIPLIMYTLFLEDLLSYKLDQEETVLSAPWDFAHHDYRHKPQAATDSITARVVGQTRTADMQTYWDHTSSWNTYSDPDYDAKDPDMAGGGGHHQALAAHQCWLGGKEIECEMNSGVGVVTIAGEFIGMNNGGLARCHAILGVQNYFIPQKFMQWWARQDMTGQKRWDGRAIHDNAPLDAYQFPEEYFSVMSDPWALNYVKESLSADPMSSGHSAASLHDPDAHPANMGSEWTNWVDIPYGLRRGKLTAAKEFAAEAKRAEFLGDTVTVDGIGDFLDTPPLAWKTDPKREFHGHGASGWNDPRHAQTQGAMTNGYMGRDDSAW
jgi:hypothetical protein